MHIYVFGICTIPSYLFTYLLTYFSDIFFMYSRIITLLSKCFCMQNDVNLNFLYRKLLRNVFSFLEFSRIILLLHWLFSYLWSAHIVSNLLSTRTTKLCWSKIAHHCGRRRFLLPIANNWIFNKLGFIYRYWWVLVYLESSAHYLEPYAYTWLQIADNLSSKHSGHSRLTYCILKNHGPMYGYAGLSY